MCPLKMIAAAPFGQFPVCFPALRNCQTFQEKYSRAELIIFMTIKPFTMPFWMLLLLLVIRTTAASPQGGQYVLPKQTLSAPKPVVPADLAHYFQLSDPKTRRIVDSYLPGVVPPANFDIVDDGGSPAGAVTVKVPTALVRGVQLAERIADGKVGNPLSGIFSKSASSTSAQEIPGKLATSGSSISGIPNVFPKLPKAPVVQPAQVGLYDSILPTRPDVPESGMGPILSSGEAKAVEGSTGGIGEIFQPLIREAQEKLQLGPGKRYPESAVHTSGDLARTRPPDNEFPSVDFPFPIPDPPQKRGGLVTQILHSIGLSKLADQISMDEVKAVSGIRPPGAPGSSVISGTLYNILSNADPKEKAKILQKGVENMAVGPNLAIIENLLLQPNSPLCLPKPATVSDFDVDSFTGRWYQVVYSPPLSSGPCSMIAYKKIADVGKGNPGTIFDTFEYTSGTAPLSKPRIASGYGIVKGPGQLIYRTSNSPNDIRVHIIKTGPLNKRGQYEYVVMTVTCNYPLHVLARDPVQYKVKYEKEVNEFLEAKKLIAGWSKALNLVAPVDYNLCIFPPTLFND
uniref:Lipocalin/cytosolic fatty-acid binding domain-containing protein n=1 Tax=Trichuris muris TaxID=70415 RepID=A0A5S6QR87_TRIMR